jgi:hypothetical protein
MKRRRAIQATGAASIGLLGGCLTELTGNAGGGVKIWNQDGSDHRFTIEIKEGNQTKFEDEVRVRAEKSEYIKNAFGGGQYTAIVKMDDEQKKTHDLTVGSCSIDFYITAEEGGDLTLGQGHCD